METYIISYNNGFHFAYTAKSLLSAKQEATKRTTYQMELDGIKITIYCNNQPLVYKSFCRFTTKASNINKWITI